MLHTETQTSIHPSIKNCSALYTVTVGDRTVLMEPRSNHDQEQKHYGLLQLAQGDHPPSSSTMYYGQVQEKQWTHLWFDLLDGDTGTPGIPQRLESGRGILCVKEGMGKYDMWFGVYVRLSCGCSS